MLNPESINLIFQSDIVTSLNRFPKWLHLSLLTDDLLVESSKNQYGLSDITIRKMIDKPSSLIKNYIASIYGGLEHTFLSSFENSLIQRTFDNPRWYINLRIDYPLLLTAIEKIDSNTLDINYNQYNDLYTKRQGQSSRIECPLFLFVKIHENIIGKISIEDVNDYYVTDFFDLLVAILMHVNTNNDLDASNNFFSHQTPYNFLIDDIFNTFKNLIIERLVKNELCLDSIVTSLFNSWVRSLLFLSISTKKIPYSLVRMSFVSFLDLLLQLHSDVLDQKRIIKSCLLSSIADKIIKICIEKMSYNSSFYKEVKENMVHLDNGKQWVINGKQWLQDIVVDISR